MFTDFRKGKGAEKDEKIKVNMRVVAVEVESRGVKAGREGIHDMIRIFAACGYGLGQKDCK